MASYFRLLTLDTVLLIILYPPRFWLEIIEIIKKWVPSDFNRDEAKQNQIFNSTNSQYFFTKNTKNAFLGGNWAYVGQPDDHIGWSHINALHIHFLLTQGPIPEIFVENIENWLSWKSHFFFKSAILIFFFHFLLHPYWNQSQIMG